MKNTLELNERLLIAVRASQFAGYDPFDMLNSRLLKATPLSLPPIWLRSEGDNYPVRGGRLPATGHPPGDGN